MSASPFGSTCRPHASRRAAGGRLRALAAGLALGLVAAVPLACCTTADPPDLEDETVPAGTVPLVEPGDSVAYVAEALQPIRPLEPSPAEQAADAVRDVRLPRIYYLLSARVRDEVSYAEFVQVWPQLAPQFRDWFVGTAVLGTEPAEVADERPAVLVYLGPEGGSTAEAEALLFVQELDSERFPGEREPVWRLRDPKVFDLLESIR